VLRVGSRSAFRLGEDEKRFLRAIAARAAALLVGDGANEARLRHALQTFESLIETSPLPIVSVDRRGVVQIWNRAAEEMFGWQRGEVIGGPLPFLPGESVEESQAILDAAHAGQVLRGREVRRMRKDGVPLDLSVSVAPLRDRHGEISGSIAILADIGERKKREAEVEQTARFREQLIGVVGHDLRNPLTAIVTSAQLLLRFAGLTEKQSRVVGRISSSADRMARMIDDLLDFARTRLGGGFPIHPRRIDLREVCEHTMEELEFVYPTRTVRLEAEGDLWGSWDPDRMAQAISNLVGNALQHSADDGEVRVTLRGEPEDVVLRTHNRGPPIPADMMPHVFEPGRRGDARSGGLGLGLYIVQQIVLAHGGNIEARSLPEDGTTFTVVLPRKARQKV
jgi:PAS domain S-box-containing protein